MASAYYNDNDPFVCEWLRNLIKAGLITDGEVDSRSIHDVQADDLRGFTRCHFFAGIGGWDYALRLAGWPDDRPVWTGSCPCQPWSQAGQRKGVADDRDMWPDQFRLIRECRPAEFFAEQVASKDGLLWLDRLQDDMEGEGYAVGAFDVPAVAVGADHRRHRSWVAAYAPGVRWEAHDRVVKGGKRRASTSTGRLSRVHVAGGWWRKSSGTVCLPTLVPNHDGLSRILAGIGNAIVPQVAAEFIGAYMEISDA